MNNIMNSTKNKQEPCSKENVENESIQSLYEEEPLLLSPVSASADLQTSVHKLQTISSNSLAEKQEELEQPADFDYSLSGNELR